MMTTTERRRLIFAAVVTIVAIVGWTLSRSSGNDDDVIATSAPTTTDPGPAEPAFLPEANGATPPSIITVNVPAPPSGTVLKGIASFIRWPETLGLRPCATPNALIGSIITVTNLDNGRKITCNNVSIEKLPGDAVIIIHTDVFMEIADLVDAPIPVRIEF
ncbi:MAG: hypothetical protein ACKOCE_09735 [Acidimicrobiia bacterium]